MIHLVLHLGAHRCGSTAIQTLLTRERDALKNAGVAVVLREDMKNGVLDLRRLHRYRPYNPLWWLKLRRAANPGTFPQHTMTTTIISEENLMGTMPVVRGHGFYPHFEKLAQGILKLGTLAGDRFIVHPRLIARRQDRYLESVYAFRVSRGLPLSFDAFVRAATKTRISWLRLARALDSVSGEDVIPKVAVLEAWPKLSSAREALTFLEVSSSMELQSPRLTGNVRYSPNGLSLMLALNRAQINWLSQNRLTDVVQEIAAEPGLSLAGILNRCDERLSSKEMQALRDHLTESPKLGFDASERAALLADYAQENRHFLSMDMVQADTEIWNSPV